MSFALLVATAGLMATAGVDRSLISGLAVTIQAMPDPIAVDGVAFTVQRVTGRDVPLLVRRVETAWQAQGSELRQLRQGEWTLLSRLTSGDLELVQWRPTTDGAELLWSRLDPAAPAQRMPETRVRLPAGCTWGRSVSGSSGRQRYLQRSAHCARSASSLSVLMQESLRAQGWELHSSSDQGLLARRKGVEGVLGLSPLQRGATWLIWLQVEAGP